MSKAKRRYMRKKRRLSTAVMKHGRKAKRAHKKKTGRTGGIMSKKNHGQYEHRRLHLPNPIGPIWSNVDRNKTLEQTR